MIKTNKTIYLFSLLFLFLFIAVGFSLATEIDWPRAPLTGEPLTKNSEFHDFIAYVYGWAIGLGGITAFTMLIIAGVQYMLSSGDPKKMVAAMQKIYSAVIGLALLLTSWLILNTINPQITSLSPLPALWDDEMYKNIHISTEMAEEPPCEFVLLFREKDFEGGSQRFTTGQFEQGFSPDPEGDITAGGGPQGSGMTFSYTSLEFLSGKGFRSMTEEEEVMYDLLGEDAFNNRDIVDGKIEGSSCLLTLYKKSSNFLGFNSENCGKILGVVSFREKNFERAIFEDEKITCFIVENIGKKEASGGGGAR